MKPVKKLTAYALALLLLLQLLPAGLIAEAAVANVKVQAITYNGIDDLSIARKQVLGVPGVPLMFARNPAGYPGGAPLYDFTPLDNDLILDARASSFNSQIWAYMFIEKNAFLNAFDPYTYIIDWSRIDSAKVQSPSEYIDYTSTGTSVNGPTNRYLRYQIQDTYGEMVLYANKVAEYGKNYGESALSMSVIAPHSLRLDENGDNYVTTSDGGKTWQVRVAVTNHASYPVYAELTHEVTVDGTKQDSFYDPDYDGQGSPTPLYENTGARNDIIFLPPNKTTIHTYNVSNSNPKKDDHVLTAKIFCRNLTTYWNYYDEHNPNFESLKPYQRYLTDAQAMEKGLLLTDYASTVAPKKAADATATVVNGIFPSTVNPLAGTDTKAITVMGRNLNLATSVKIQKAQGTQTIVNNYTPSSDGKTATVTLSATNVPDEGLYSLTFYDSLGAVLASDIYITASNSVVVTDWNTYGRLTLKQNAQKTFDVDLGNEQGSVSSAGSLLTIRGAVAAQAPGNSWAIAQGSTINGALRYKDAGDRTLVLRKFAVQAESGYILESTSNDAELIYGDICVAKGQFAIKLFNGTLYSAQKEYVEGTKPYENVRLSYPAGNSFYNLNFYGLEVEAGGLILYHDDFSLTGKVGIAELVPDFIEPFFNVQLDLHELRLKPGKDGMPALKASGELTAGGSFMTVVTAGGNMKFSMDTLPETPESEHHMGFSGELDLTGLLHVDGELRFEPAFGYFVPDTLLLYVDAGLGVVLVPPVPAAKINGFGGGIENIADTLTGRGYKYIPDLTLHLYGGVADITGELLSADKAGITLSPSGVSSRVGSVMILGFNNVLHDIQYGVRIFDAKQEFKLNGNTIPLIGVKFEGSGEFNLFDFIVGSAGVYFAFDPSLMDLNAFTALVKSFSGSQAVDTAKAILAAVDFGGHVDGRIKIPDYIAAIGGLVLAGGRAELSKTRALVRTTVLGVDFEVSYDWSRFLQRNSFARSVGPVEPQVSITNVRTLPSNSADDSGMFFLRAAGTVSNQEVTATVKKLGITVSSSDPTSVTYTVTDPSGNDTTITYDAANWIECETDDGTPNYWKTLYTVDNPESGTWRVTSDASLTVEWHEILPLPTVKNVAKNTDNVDFELENLENDVDYVARLYITAYDATAATVNSETAILLSEKDAVTNGSYTFTAPALPIDLPSGTYVYQVALMKKITDADNKKTLELVHKVDSGNFDFTNASAPGVMDITDTDKIGNGQIKVKLTPPNPVPDGYLVTIIDPATNKVASDTFNGADGPYTDAIAATMNIDGTKTEFVVQGGQSEPDALGNVFGIPFGKNTDNYYKISVTPYNNVEVGERYDANGNLVLDENQQPIKEYSRVAGMPVVSDSIQFIAPVFPIITLAGQAGTVLSARSADHKVFVGKTPTVTATIDATDSYKLVELWTGGNETTGTGPVSITPPVAEGAYDYKLEVTNTSGDYAQELFTIVVDTTPPVLMLTANPISDSGIASFGGNTEAGARLTVNGDEIPVNNGLFNVNAATSGVLSVQATDEAGNSSLTEQMVNVQVTGTGALFNSEVQLACGTVIPLGYEPALAISARNAAGAAVTIPGSQIAWTVTPYSVTQGGAQGSAVTQNGRLVPQSAGDIKLTGTYYYDSVKYSATIFITIVDKFELSDLVGTALSASSATLNFSVIYDATAVAVERSADNGATWQPLTSFSYTPGSTTMSLTGLSTGEQLIRLKITGGLYAGYSNAAVVDTSAFAGSSGQTRTDTVTSGTGGTTGGTALASVTINGIQVPAVISADGTLTIKPTEQDVKKIIAAAKEGQYVFGFGSVKDVTGVQLELDPAWFDGTGDKMLLDLGGIGSVLISDEMMKELRLLDGKVTFIIKKGSIVFDIQQQGKSIGWYNFEHPIVLSMPAASASVMIDNATGKVIPRSWYADGKVYTKVYATGAYDAKSVSAQSFADTKGQWMDTATLHIADRGVIYGIGDNLFAPGRNVTRGEFVTMLMRAVNIEPQGDWMVPQFGDAKEGAFYYDALLKAKALGLVSGVGDNKFAPDAQVTRQDMFVMLYNAMVKCNMIAPSPGGMALQEFNDSGEIASYANEALLTFAQDGIVGGKGNGMLDPRGTATRAEAAQVMYNVLIRDAK